MLKNAIPEDKDPVILFTLFNTPAVVFLSRP